MQHRVLARSMAAALAAVLAVAAIAFFAWGLLGPEPRWIYALLNAVMAPSYAPS